MGKHAKKKKSKFEKISKFLYFGALLCLMACFIPLFALQDEEGVIAFVDEEQLRKDEGYVFVLGAVEKLLETDGVNSIEEIRYMLFDNLNNDDYRKDVMIKYNGPSGVSTKYFRESYVSKQIDNIGGYGHSTVEVLEVYPIEKNDYMITKKMTYLSQISPEPFGFKIREYTYDAKSVEMILAEVKA